MRFAYAGEAFATGHDSRGIEGTPVFEVRYDARSFEARAVLMTGSSSALDSLYAACRDNLMLWSRDLGVTHGDRLTLTDTVADGSATITSVTGGWSSSDVGLPIDVGGTLAQIVTYTSSTEIVLSKSVAAGTVTSSLGYAQIRAIDGETALLLRPTVTKPGDDGDTDLSRFLTFRVDWQHPADDAADLYRRDATISVTWDASSKRVLTIAGTYTADGGTGARARYDANIGAYVTSVFTALSLTSGNFELVAQNADNQDDEDALLLFSRTYREIFFNQVTGSRSSPNIRDHQIAFRRAPGAVLGIQRQPVIRGSISYAATIDHDNLTASGMKAFWVDDLKPHILTEFASQWGGGSIIIESEETSLDAEASAIQSTISVILHSSARFVVSYERRGEQRWISGDNWRKLHDGRAHTYTRWGPGATVTMDETVTAITIGRPWNFPRAKSSPETPVSLVEPSSGSGAEWIETARSLAFSREFHGRDIDNEGTEATFYIRTFVRSMLWAATSITSGSTPSVPTGGGGFRPITG